MRAFLLALLLVFPLTLWAQERPPRECMDQMHQACGQHRGDPGAMRECATDAIPGMSETCAEWYKKNGPPQGRGRGMGRGMGPGQGMGPGMGPRDGMGPNR